MNRLINDEAVYRTAPATPGLLKKRTLKLDLIYSNQFLRLHKPSTIILQRGSIRFGNYVLCFCVV